MTNTIKAMMAKKGKSRKELAADMGITETTLGNWFKKDDFTESELNRICAAMGGVHVEIKFVTDEGEVYNA